ncbi:putative polysaccharide polymerase [Halobacillus halophilus DSM 2266]|uniref:Polysaccharide polymerase n=1 Tax=Halobacillus halophilus (strain ATCC 35676 / DSM 2266 / JCM 20832 / KCTC 3685 / LMG 17431 / NBRC 102448 / NCIMB 2269) TaxID=866895 RepID=I0JRI8_HALH3|nr:O-antigen ligase family protein [Halobacillus halophilus]CCG46759.1 putative polysaccharide polymerase [Halobacillus halophilus DSM 2266]
MKLMKSLFSSEFLFAFFLLSSTAKLAVDEWVPVDLTLIFMVLSIVAAIKVTFKNKGVPKKIVLPAILYSFLCLIMLISLFYTPSSSYAITKTLKFMFLTGWSFFGGFLVIRNRQSLRKFLKSFAGITILVSGIVIWNYYNSPVQEELNRLGVDGGSVLGLAKMTAMGSIIVLILYFYGAAKKRVRFFLTGVLGLLLIALLLTGSRMALIAFVLTLFFIAILSIKFSINDIKIKKSVFKFIPLIPLALVGLIPLYRNGTIDTLLMRMQFLFNEQGAANSISERINRYNTSIHMFENDIFKGGGIGSFAIKYSGLDERHYPHNMFLEFMSELGIFGIATFLTLLIAAVWCVISTIRTQVIAPEQISVILLLVFQLFNVNTTGDFNDNRIFFAFLGLTFMIGSYKMIDKSNDYMESINE